MLAPEACPNLQLALRRPINSDLIALEYDNMVKYAVALRAGTAEAAGAESAPAPQPATRVFCHTDEIAGRVTVDTVRSPGCRV
jgi:hypothetical protein